MRFYFVHKNEFSEYLCYHINKKLKKEVLPMGNINTYRCENCNRTNEFIQLNRVTLNHHTAHLCLACEHVLTLPNNEDRFFQLIRNKKRQHSNIEMQKAHRVLSAFIAVGMLFLVVIAAFAVTQGNGFSSIAFQKIQSIPTNKQLTFLHLKSFN